MSKVDLIVGGLVVAWAIACGALIDRLDVPGRALLFAFAMTLFIAAFLRGAQSGLKHARPPAITHREVLTFEGATVLLESSSAEGLEEMRARAREVVDGREP